MKVSWVFGAALALSLPLWGFAQTPLTIEPTILELRLQPESVRKHIPQAFTVLIVNKSHHEVRLPMPSLECGDVPHGTVRLHVKFKPFKAGGVLLFLAASRTLSISRYWIGSSNGRFLVREKASF